MIVPVILSGGSGSRLWPLSRPSRPKQLMAMVGERTMLGATLDRIGSITAAADPWVVCNAGHRHLVADELTAAGLPAGNVILEPVGRNTAPAAAAAAVVMAGATPGEHLMLILPADHVIADEAAFQRAVAVAAGPAAAGKLVTFGIVPTYPETGYGYIEVGVALGDDVAAIARFVEKPDATTAAAYLASGAYLWNSGMFLFSPEAYLAELERFAPEIVTAVRRAVDGADGDGHGGIRLDPAAFSESPADSIDYAVMEHTAAGVVVPLDAGWSDVGSWAAVWELETAGDGNSIVGDVVATDVTGSYLRAESRLVAAVGVDDLVVVETPDAVLVASRHRSQEVKGLVDTLLDAERPEATTHDRIEEEWGSWQLLQQTEDFELRLITIGAGSASATLPPRDFARTWIGAAGTGIVEFAGESVDIHTGSAAIPPGVAVAVRQTSDATLVIVEIARAEDH